MRLTPQAQAADGAPLIRLGARLPGCERRADDALVERIDPIRLDVLIPDPGVAPAAGDDVVRDGSRGPLRIEVQEQDDRNRLRRFRRREEVQIDPDRLCGGRVSDRADDPPPNRCARVGGRVGLRNLPCHARRARWNPSVDLRLVHLEDLRPTLLHPRPRIGHPRAVGGRADRASCSSRPSPRRSWTRARS